MTAFRWQNRMRFHQADPAGWMFFGRAFELAHDCLEDFLVEAGIPWKDWFANSQLAMPIRKAEADYVRPIAAGELYEVQAEITKLGQTSIGFQFRFLVNSELCLTLKSTHVLISTQSKTPTPWPDSLRQRLEVYVTPRVGDPL